MNEPIMKKPSETNWERVEAMTDDMIDTSDIPPLTEEWFKYGERRMPKNPVTVTVEVETDVLAWYKAQDDDYARRMSAVLRIYAEAHLE
jgi:uncharacterized protein (DUF4415 family)